MVKYKVVESLRANTLFSMSWLEEVDPEIDWNTKNVSQDGDGCKAKVQALNGHQCKPKTIVLAAEAADDL